MTSAVLEIVELGDGRIALRHVEANELLVTLEFSGKAIGFLRGQHRDVARAMIDTGVHMAGSVMSGLREADEEIPAVLH